MFGSKTFAQSLCGVLGGFGSLLLIHQPSSHHLPSIQIILSDLKAGNCGLSFVEDMLNMLGRTLDTKIVEEMREARTGGEYAALLGENAMGNNERYEPIMFFLGG